MTDKWELSSFHLQSYGWQAWEPKPHLCAEEVADRNSIYSFAQCSRKRGHGPEQAFCKQHDPAAKKAREYAREAKWARERAIENNAQALPGSASMFLETLRKIADGHNDPREIAQEAIANYEAKLKPVPGGSDD